MTEDRFNSAERRTTPAACASEATTVATPSNEQKQHEPLDSVAKVNNRFDVPHKRSSSKIMSTPDTAPKNLVGASFFEAMSNYKPQDSREKLHVTRRRKLSPTNENEEVDTSSKGDSEAALNDSFLKDDIRRELQSEDQSAATIDLPDPDVHESPEIFLQKLVKVMCSGLELEAKNARTLEGFFAKATDAQIEAYTTAVVTVCRNNDLVGLKELQAKGHQMNCVNRFGESLLHMACRRGFEDIVDFLLEQPELDIRMCDDNGRTVLHDACWNPSPQLKICQRILERDPALFFISDNRGCSAFQYARPEHWGVWRKFLLENRECLKALTNPDDLDILVKAP